jgi:diacylglycerol kinase (ATP)
MPRNIIYIINPVSGTKTSASRHAGKKSLQSFIEQKTKEQAIPYQIFPSAADGDYSFLHSLIREQKITDIVIAGGDGTINRAVSSLMNLDINFGIIPCGSGNGLAHTAKIPKQPSGALDIIFNGKASAIDGFYINDRFACMLCGVGFDAKVAHDFALDSKRGLSTYVKLILKNFFPAKAYPFEIQLADRSFNTDAFFINIANSNQFGNNFTIAPKASLNDGLLDIVIATRQNKAGLFFQILKQVMSRNPLQKSEMVTGQKGVIYFQTEKLTIINPSQAPLHIDGDPAETSGKFVIEIKKNCFRLLQP